MPTFPTLSYVCPIRWTEMRGDERERFCSKCARIVVNLSLLTEPERAALLASAKPGELCVAYYRRLSGEFVSAENPLSPVESRRLLQYGAATLTAAAALAVIAPKLPATADALGQAQQTVSTTYIQAGQQTVSRAIDMLGDVGELFGAKRERPALILGMMVCPPPVPPVPPPVTPSPGPVSPPSKLVARQAG